MPLEYLCLNRKNLSTTFWRINHNYVREGHSHTLAPATAPATGGQEDFLGQEDRSTFVDMST